LISQELHLEKTNIMRQLKIVYLIKIILNLTKIFEL